MFNIQSKFFDSLVRRQEKGYQLRVITPWICYDMGAYYRQECGGKFSP